jgi:hypothetical protein
MFKHFPTTVLKIWGTLRMAVSLMGRPDLYDICDRNDLDSLNREFNMESWYQDQLVPICR